MTSSPVVLTMHDSRPLKQAFLKNLLLGLRARAAASKDMTFRERKDAVRLAADSALASARGGAPRWSRALAAELESRPSPLAWKPTEVGRKSLRRSLRRPRKAAARVLARAAVRRRTRVLKEIVPGGKGLDECALLGETLDYAMALRAQADVMQLLVTALQGPKPYAGSADEKSGFRKD